MHRFSTYICLAFCLAYSSLYAAAISPFPSSKLFTYQNQQSGHAWVFSGGYPPTFNANSYVPAYTGNFGYGTNMGYYGGAWTDDQIAQAFRSIGGSTLRVTLPEKFLRSWGYGVRTSSFRYYGNNMGLTNLTATIGEPSDIVRDHARYDGINESAIFANLYQPIWNSDGSVNQNNYYAYYVYQAVQNYGEYVRFWEVMNEPDFSPGTNVDNWYSRNPTPGELPNIRAPFTYYVRMLRIAYEVIKTYKPDDLVAVGGIGYDSFLDAILRNTDNPDNGTVTGDYPQKGGAYFDVLSFHYYPIYALHSWNNNIMNFDYHRHSDAAVNGTLNHKNILENTLKKYGYGSSYPQKHVIITETNVGRKTTGSLYGSNEYQRNYVMKMMVQAQKNGIKQVDFFMTGETANYNDAWNENQVMGFFENLFRDAPGSQKMTLAGIGHKTVAELLAGYNYDAGLTAQLALPANAEGAAFKKGSDVYYVLYAKTTTDMNEWTTVSYNFPAELNVKTLTTCDWNYSVTGQKNTISGSTVQLTATPVIYKIAETLSTNNLVAQSGPINYKYYESSSTWWNLPDFNQLSPTATGTTSAIDLSVAKRAENYGLLFEGYINIPVTGNYTFETYSDDGSKLFIGNYNATSTPLVNNDGSHGMQFQEGSIYLNKGIYPIAIAYMQGGVGAGLQVYWKNTANGVTDRQLIPKEYFVGAPASTLSTTAGNIDYKYYETSENWWSIPDFNTLSPVASGKTSAVDLSIAKRSEHYGIVYSGYIRIPQTGNYTFETNSDDGSRFYLGGMDNYNNIVVDNNGSHAARFMEGTRYLAGGVYPFYVTYMQNVGPATLELYWKNTAHGVTNRQIIPQDYFVDGSSGVTKLAMSKNSLSEEKAIAVAQKAGVYPNPVTEQINLNLGDDFSFRKTLSLQLSDVSGHILKTENFKQVASNVKMDIQGLNLNTGIYLLKVWGDQAKAQTFKIIKK